DRIGQLDLAAQHAAQHVAAEEQVRAQDHAAEQPVKHGRLPFDEGIVVQPQRCTAKHHDDGQVDPVHYLDLATREAQPADLTDTGRHGDGGGDVDIGEPIRDKEQD